MKDRSSLSTGSRDDVRPRRRSDEASSSTVRVDETIGLAAIFEPHANVVVLERRAPPSLAAYAARIARGVAFSFKATTAFEQPRGLDALDELAAQLAPDDARDVLVEDLAYWVEVVTQLTGSRRVGLRLARLDAPMCPGFHVDRVTVRLVCTYAGAPTEWLDERDVDRSVLAGPSPMPVAAAVRHDAEVHRCSTLDVLLLKGAAWPGNELRGAIHRSPPRSASPRLLLTLDPLG
ncbi:MAG: DUF1826 domain-containing protein [Labilithrix sp.]|nr:DUF1826 domain-containing protein [Labilithrix sp.]